MPVFAMPGARRARFPSLSALCGLFALAAAAPALAEAPSPGPSLSIEINKAEQLEATCRLVFMAHNGLGVDLSELSLETVLFDTEGGVERFTLFDFRDVPAGKTRARQFDLPDTRCEGIGRVLINGAAACAGDGLSGAECIEHLEPTSRTAMEITG